MEKVVLKHKATYLICFAITRPSGGQSARVQSKARTFQGTDGLLHSKQGSLYMDRVDTSLCWMLGLLT